MRARALGVFLLTSPLAERLLGARRELEETLS